MKQQGESSLPSIDGRLGRFLDGLERSHVNRSNHFSHAQLLHIPWKACYYVQGYAHLGVRIAFAEIHRVSAQLSAHL